MTQNRYNLFLANRTTLPLVATPDQVFCAVKEDLVDSLPSALQYAKDPASLAERVALSYVSRMEEEFGKELTRHDLITLSRYGIVDTEKPKVQSLRAENFVLSDFMTFSQDQKISFNKSFEQTIFEKLIMNAVGPISYIELP